VVQSAEQLQQLLVIGVTATVRHGLGIVATRGEPWDITLNLAVDALAAPLSVIGLWLVRNQLQQEGREARRTRAGKT
jgi:hypothetical protein